MHENPKRKKAEEKKKKRSTTRLIRRVLLLLFGLLFRRTVQRRHFGLPADNDGGAGREYLWGWVVALFDGACLLVGGSAIVARGTITVVRV